MGKNDSKSYIQEGLRDYEDNATRLELKADQAPVSGNAAIQQEVERVLTSPSVEAAEFDTLSPEIQEAIEKGKPLKVTMDFNSYKKGFNAEPGEYGESDYGSFMVFVQPGKREDGKVNASVLNIIEEGESAPWMTDKDGNFHYFVYPNDKTSNWVLKMTGLDRKLLPKGQQRYRADVDSKEYTKVSLDLELSTPFTPKDRDMLIDGEKFNGIDEKGNIIKKEE